MIRDLSAPLPRAFISYARADGEPFATALRQRLEREHPEIILWQDRARMEGGIGWWKQITDALERVQILIMVMTSAASNSEVARKEWRYARQQGVRICPVFGTSERRFDFAALPSWMSKSHFYDLNKEWDTFIAFLQSPHKESRVPFMAPDLREGYVPRVKEYEALATRLLHRERAEPVAITTALQGSGGFGKTTLAIALCHDDDVINAFDDGILWTTLGEKPNLQLELTKLYAALTGDRPPFVDVEDAAISIAARLEDKNCLIVIDDAWDAHHVEPFLRGGKQHSARLLTTRQLGVVTEINATRVLVNEMSESEAVQVLLRAFPEPPPQLEPLRVLARRLGEWPLLLKLAASQLRARMERGDSVAGALSFVNRALDKRGAVAFDRSISSSRHDAVARTVGVSLDLLKGDERQRCAELSIFPEDRAVPLSAVRALWGLDEFDTEEVLQKLDAASLLEFDLKTASLRMHDVFRSFLGSLLEDPAAVHRRLVQAGWTDPYALPDAYAWRWFAWHASKGGEHELLRSLLFDFDWMQAKHLATEIHGLVQDYELLAADPAAQLVQDALRLSSAALSRYPTQLATQLSARLAPGAPAPIDGILKKAAARAPRPWLNLMHRSLTPPGGPLVAILKSHTDSIKSIAVSVDGRWVLSGAKDSTLRLWDLESDRIERILENHSAITSVAMSPDAHRAVCGSEDRAIRSWNLQTGTVEREQRYHSGIIHALAIAPNGRHTYSISEDGTLCVWDLETGEVKRLLRGYSHSLHALVVTSDGRYVLFGSGDMNIVAVDIHRREIARIFEGHTAVVRALAISSDGRWVASGSEDHTVRIWKFDTARTERILEGHADTVHAVAFIEDAQRLASGSADKSIRLWNVESGQLLQTLEGHSRWVSSLATHPDGRRVISGSGDSTLRVWQVATVADTQPLKAHLSAVSLLSISSNGARAVSGSSRSRILRVWDVADKRVACTLEGHQGEVLAVAMSADGERLLSGASDKTLRLWDLRSGDTIHVLKGHASYVFMVALTPDGTRAISLSRDRTMRVWDLTSGRALLAARRSGYAETSSAFLDLETGKVLDILRAAVGRDSLVALSADGTRLAFTSGSSLFVWELETGTTRNIELHDFDPVCLATDRDVRLAVIGSRWGTVGICDLDQCSTQLLAGHSGSIFDAVITDDGRAVTASRGALRVWDLKGNRDLHAVEGLWNQSESIVISPSGELAYSILGDTVSAAMVRTGADLGSISLDHNITSVVVARDDRTVALGDDSGHVHFVCLEHQ